MKRINRVRRWLARLVMTNYVAIFFYFISVGNIEKEAAFIISVIILGYNYFVMRFVIQLPKGYLHWVNDKYLLIPAVISIGLSCFLVVLQLFLA